MLKPSKNPKALAKGIGALKNVKGIHSLKLTANAPANRPKPKKETIVFQASIFRCENVSFREGRYWVTTTLTQKKTEDSDWTLLKSNDSNPHWWHQKNIKKSKNRWIAKDESNHPERHACAWLFANPPGYWCVANIDPHHVASHLHPEEAVQMTNL